MHPWPWTLVASLLIFGIGLQWVSRRVGAERVDQWCFAHRDHLPLPFLTLGILSRLVTRATSAGPRWCGELTMPGLALITLGESLRIWAVGIVGAATRSASTNAKRFVTEGPYAITRNPIYVGNFLLCIGLACFSASWAAAMACTAYFVLAYGRIIRAEERFLHATFGAVYEDYCRRVPRLLPHWHGAWHQLRAPFNLHELRKEHQTIAGITCAALLIHTVALQPWQGWLGSRHAATRLAFSGAESSAQTGIRVTTVTLEQALQHSRTAQASPVQEPRALRAGIVPASRRTAASSNVLDQMATWLRWQLPSAMAGGLAFAGTYLASCPEETCGEEFEEQLPTIASTTLIALAVHSVVSQMTSPSMTAFASDHSAHGWTLTPSVQVDREEERVEILMRVQF